jgi:hypothetical protein
VGEGNWIGTATAGAGSGAASAAAVGNGSATAASGDSSGSGWTLRKEKGVEAIWTVEWDGRFS